MFRLSLVISFLFVVSVCKFAFAATGEATCAQNNGIYEFKYDNAGIELDGQKFVYLGDLSEAKSFYAIQKANRCKATKLMFEKRASSFAAMLDNLHQYGVARKYVLKSFYCKSAIYKKELDRAISGELDALDKLFGAEPDCLPDNFDTARDWQEVRCEEAYEKINVVSQSDQNALSNIAIDNLNNLVVPIMVNDIYSFYENWLVQLDTMAKKIIVTKQYQGNAEVVDLYNCKFKNHQSNKPAISMPIQ